MDRTSFHNLRCERETGNKLALTNDSSNILLLVEASRAGIVFRISTCRQDVLERTGNCLWVSKLLISAFHACVSSVIILFPVFLFSLYCK